MGGGDALILKRAAIGNNVEDYDVLADDKVVGRIFLAAHWPRGTAWIWALAYGEHEDRSPTRGYEPTRKAAMAAFAKSWRKSYGHDSPSSERPRQFALGAASTTTQPSYTMLPRMFSTRPKPPPPRPPRPPPPPPPPKCPR